MGFGPGQHSLLYFSESGKILESHTLGVADWGTAVIAAPSAATPISPTDESKKEAVVSLIEPRNQDFTSVNFLIRAHGGATAWPKHQIASSSSRTIVTSVLTEEPFEDHHATQQSLLIADMVLCTIGGIDIASALGFIQKHARMSGRRGGVEQDEAVHLSLAR
ncbi:hypothetical protein ColLi_11803 [Colletotrichum liriopes]|uniref:Uncharacterized protein n=1 Tax=Colletotrichum liriopes TaxID=708192 RepID=A0AA37GYC2_9PEZI|nr:hypothetical protein ColLi_11803 [Colletotrichum liriopes]